MKNVLIIGNGAFGVAISQVLLHNKNCNVFMYSKNPSAGQELMQGKHSAFVNTKLTPPHKCYSDYNEAFNHQPIDIIVLCVPSIAINDIFVSIKQYLKANMIVINTAKGLNPHDCSMWSELFLQSKLVKDYYLMVGPSFASEIVAQHKTIVNIVGKNLMEIKAIEKLFNNEYFKLVYFDDEYTASLVSSFKNSLALGLGLLSVDCTSINTQAAYLIIGLNEIQALVAKLTNCEKIRILDFYGVGDIYLTCTSDESRNYQFGIDIGRLGFTVASENLNSQTIEGYRTLKLIKYYLDTYNLPSVLFQTLYEVCYENYPANEFVATVWKRFNPR